MPSVLDKGMDLDIAREFGVAAGRIIFAPMTTVVPTDIGDMIQTSTASNANEVQTLTITGTPTGGSFKLRYRGNKTTIIAYNANAAAVQAALEAVATVGTSNVTCGGGPLPGSAVTITFVNNLAARNTPLIVATDQAFTGGTTPAAAVAETTKGVGIYEVKTGWNDLGPTLGGITFSFNNTEQTYTVDQVNADVFAIPNGTELTVAAAVSKIDLPTMQMIYEGGAISTIAPSGNTFLPLGSASYYTQRRVAILSMGPSVDGGVTDGQLRAVFFRIAQLSPQERSVVWQKEGTQQAPAFTWKIMPDLSVLDERARYGGIFMAA